MILTATCREYALCVMDQQPAITSKQSDAFSVLGLPPTFDLDRARVERSFLSKMRLVHPDTAGQTADISELETQSAVLTIAKRTLLDDESRAALLLTLLGGPRVSEDKSLPPGFLMEVMSLREEIEEDLASDAVAARAKWGPIAAQRDREYNIRVSALFRAYLQSQEGAADHNLLVKIRSELNAWRYTRRLIEQLAEHNQSPQAG